MQRLRHNHEPSHCAVESVSKVGVHSSSGRPSGEKKSAPRRIAPSSSFKLTHNATILADSTSASRRESVI